MSPRVLLVALGGAAIAFAFAFVLPVFVSEPVAWYYPTAHAWAFEVRPSGIAMDFYGRLAQAIAAWIAVFVPLVFVLRRRAIGDRALGLVVTWSVTVVIFVMLFYAWTLHYRVP